MRRRELVLWMLGRRLKPPPGACNCKKCVRPSSIFLKVRYNLVLDVRL